MTIATEEDLIALQSRGFDAVYPHQSPWDILRASAAARPHAEAIRYLPDGSDTARWDSVTYASLRDRVGAAGAVFRDLGVGPGDSVGLLVANTIWGQVALWGAQLAGAACPVNPMLRADHIAALLRLARAKVVVVMGVNPELDWWSTLVPALRDALREQGLDLPIIACDAASPSPGADGDLEALVGDRLGQTLTPAGGPEATAGWYHTGGTTGRPKLVRHSRLNQAFVARSCELVHDLSARDVVINGFPLFHVAGAFVYGLSAFSAGATTVIPGRLGYRNRAFTESIWQQVERHQVSVLAAVPTMMAAWLAVPVDARIGSVRVMLTGGSPLPTELAQRFEQTLGVPVRNILGMTECAGAVSLEPVHGPRIAQSCGLRLPFTEVRAVDPEDTGRGLAAGQTGIVALRGPNVSSGYSDPSRNPGTFEDG
ncbi:MAG: AMP-binding protein, partial [Pararhodobacter sp.]